MDKKDFMNNKRKEISRAFEGKDISGLFDPLSKDVEFKKLIASCPFCGKEPYFYDSVNNLTMTGSWNMVCDGCDMRMREDFVIGKEKDKAEKLMLKRWNNRA